MSWTTLAWLVIIVNLLNIQWWLYLVYKRLVMISRSASARNLLLTQFDKERRENLARH